jgi:pimeloyl-ACP methyl ester carboxylesterase
MLAANCDYGGLGMPNATALCDAYYAQFLTLTSKVNIYNIYGICYGTSIDPQAEEGDEILQKKRGMTARDYTPWAFPDDEFLSRHGLDGGDLPPCTFGTPLMEYFDRVDVRAALHIPEQDPTIGPWVMCTSNIDYTRGKDGSIQKYKDLHGKIRMMHFSGDVDGAVGTDGTQGWIDSLDWEITGDWAVWYYDDPTLGKQDAGFVTEYVDDFTFIIVHGAGHMVPEDKPPQAIQMMYNWINQVDLSNNLNIINGTNATFPQQ